MAAGRRRSSPQMRGAHSNATRPRMFHRIIPADAGSTRNFYEIDPVLEDHPRRCGEHSSMGVRPARWVGSSPQMRGALKACALYISHNRIIPADAGSTPSIARTIPSSRDHPRRCGEHCSAFALSIFESGSSPQMRGALSYWHNRQTRQPIQAIGDHPRRCGEHTPLSCPVGVQPGSSPQMRGAL